MEGIRQIGLLLCAVSLLAMLAFYLLPKLELSAAVKACAGVFCMAAVIAAILNTRFDPELDFSALREQRAQKLEQKAMQSTLRLTENAVSDAIYGELKKEGYDVKSVTVSLHILSDSSIEFSRIQIEVSQLDAAAAAAYVSRVYGITPQVVISGAKGDAT